MLTKEELGKAISDAAQKKGVKAADMARHFNVQPPSVNGWLKTGRISKDKLPALYQYFSDVVGPEHWGLEDGTPLMQSTTNDLSSPAPLSGNKKPVPVVGTAQLGDNGHWSELEYPVGHGDGVIDWHTNDPKAYALRCKGDSMSPRIKPNEFVIVEPSTDPCSGDEVMVKSLDGRVMVKELLYIRDDVAHLASVNESHGRITMEMSEIEKMHFVGGIARKNKWRPE